MCQLGAVIKVRCIKASRPIVAVRFWDYTKIGGWRSVFRRDVVWKGAVCSSVQPRVRGRMGRNAGFWAFKPQYVPPTRAWLGYTSGRTRRGKVKLWGKVVEHTLGYRAGFAQRVPR